MEQDKLDEQTQSGDKVETAKEEMITRAEAERLADARATQAISTREKNIKLELEKKYEQEKLLAEGKYKALWETEKAEKESIKAFQMAQELKLQTIEKLRENKLDELSFLFDEDTSNIDSRVNLAKKISEIISIKVESAVNEKIKSPAGIKQVQDNRSSFIEGQVKEITMADLASAKKSK
jgi:hypothetical protein